MKATVYLLFAVLVSPAFALTLERDIPAEKAKLRLQQLFSGMTVHHESELLAALEGFTLDGSEHLAFTYKSHFSTDTLFLAERRRNSEFLMRKYERYLNSGQPRAGTLYVFDTYVNGIRNGPAPSQRGITIKVADTGEIVSFDADFQSAGYQKSWPAGEPIPWPHTGTLTAEAAIGKVLTALADGHPRGADALRAYGEQHKALRNIIKMQQPTIVPDGAHSATPYHCTQVRRLPQNGDQPRFGRKSITRHLCWEVRIEVSDTPYVDPPAPFLDAICPDRPNNRWHEIYHVYKPAVRLLSEQNEPEWRIGNLLPVWRCDD